MIISILINTIVLKDNLSGLDQVY